MTGPLSEKQAAFLRAEDARINVLTGSVRSGKTYASLLKWALFVQGSEADSEFIMCGKTMITLERNCLTLLARLTGRFTYSLSKKEGWLYGRRVWLEGANDEQAESKIRGLTLWGAYVDELTLVPEGFYRMLLSRLSAPGARLYATTNPDAPGHWAKEAVIDAAGPDVAVWTFLLRDNVFLDPEYVEAIERQYTGIWRERYILGRWTRAEGVIYPLFADEPARFWLTGRTSRSRWPRLGWTLGGTSRRRRSWRWGSRGVLGGPSCWTRCVVRPRRKTRKPWPRRLWRSRRAC